MERISRSQISDRKIPYVRYAYDSQYGHNIYTGPTKAYCESLAAKLKSQKDLPQACLAYFAIPDEHVDPFAGMRPGSAVSARATRAKGQEHHAQIQRRLTTSGTRRFSKLEK